MLQRRLTRRSTAAALLSILLVPGCAGVDGTERGAIRENVVEPGITAIGEAREQACGLNATTLATALETYLLLEGEPAPDEAALVAEGYLRQETDAWDVVDGVLVPEDPACGPVPDASAAPTTIEIVTETEPIGAVDDVYAGFTAEEIASMGGPDCARQLAVVVDGVNRFVEATGGEPDSLEAVDAAGFFVEPVTMWQVVDDVLRPASGSTCRDFVAIAQVTDDGDG